MQRLLSLTVKSVSIKSAIRWSPMGKASTVTSHVFITSHLFVADFVTVDLWSLSVALTEAFIFHQGIFRVFMVLGLRIWILNNAVFQVHTAFWWHTGHWPSEFRWLWGLHVYSVHAAAAWAETAAAPSAKWVEFQCLGRLSKHRTSVCSLQLPDFYGCCCFT